MNGVNPFVWFKDILERIPSFPIKNITELLPHMWAQAQNQIDAIILPTGT
jgi:transposase IS66-like protein